MKATDVKYFSSYDCVLTSSISLIYLENYYVETKKNLKNICMLFEMLKLILTALEKTELINFKNLVRKQQL